MFVSSRYPAGFDLFGISLKLKISGPCQQNKFQPQTHEKTHIYTLSKGMAFFLPRGQAKMQILSYSLSLMVGAFFPLVHYFTIH